MFLTCHFPLLVKLDLYSEYSASTAGQNLLSTDPLIVDFLIAHSTIEDLRWYPADQGLPIPYGLLPRLKRILSYHRITVSILRDPSLVQQRKMELISQISLGPNTMQLLATIDGSRLQELHIWRIDHELDPLRRIATLFPNIRTLVIPNFGNPIGNGSYSRSFVRLQYFFIIAAGYSRPELLGQVHRLPSLLSCLGTHPGVFALVGRTNAERAREIGRTTKIGDAMQTT